jgi:hypothetical protein
MNIATVGLDLAKSVLLVHAMDLQGHIAIQNSVKTVRCAHTLTIGDNLSDLLASHTEAHSGRLISDQYVRVLGE